MLKKFRNWLRRKKEIATPAVSEVPNPVKGMSSLALQIDSDHMEDLEESIAQYIFNLITASGGDPTKVPDDYQMPFYVYYLDGTQLEINSFPFKSLPEDIAQRVRYYFSEVVEAGEPAMVLSLTTSGVVSLLTGADFERYGERCVQMGGGNC
jgi:hypothetical protein